MNELEERLRTLLLDATAGTAPQPGMLREATCRAVQVQRRRMAARGAVGAAALAATGVVMSWPDDGSSGRLDYAASASPSPSTVEAMEPVHVTLIHTTSCEGVPPVQDSTKVCQTLALSVGGRGSGAGSTTRLVTDAGRYPEPPTAKELIVIFADGTERREPAHSEGAGRWFFDTELPAGAEYVLDLEHDDRNQVTVRVTVCRGSEGTCNAATGG